MHQEERNLVAAVLEALYARGLTVAAAEADTGGLVTAWLTAEPGSSAAVLGGVAAYHDDLKRGLLGIPSEVIEEHGAVSEAVVRCMAEQVRQVTGADVGLATTGVAGPGGGTATKPVGLAWVAVASKAGTIARAHQWPGDRLANRRASARAVLALALTVLDVDP